MVRSIQKDAQMEKNQTACFQVQGEKWRAVKIYAAANGLRIQDLLLEMLDEWMAKKKIKPLTGGK